MEPKSEIELAELLMSAKAPIQIKGGGTRGIASDDQVLSTKGFSGISLYQPGALTMVAGAGTPLSDITAALDAENQMLPFEPYDLSVVTGSYGKTTIGGVFATNASGSRRLQVGAARDFLLGVRFVDGVGRIVKNGGRVMKNVTGYDLVKLMAGSHGTLGVITQVSFKVLPKPQATGYLSANDTTPEQAVAIMTRASKTPYDISGAWYDLAKRKVTIRIEGFAQSVDYRTEKLKESVSNLSKLEPDDEGAGNSFLSSETSDDIWKITCKPTDAVSVSKQLDSDNQLFDWAGGRIWARVPSGFDVRAKIDGLPAIATLMKAAPETAVALGRFQPEAPGVARLSQGLRQKFDPRGILNKGLMG